jgi:holo-[acyl-carrier protein] synthase
MIVGIGIDIIEISRIEKASKEAFIDKYFTAKEAELFEEKKGRAETIAGNFAAKEAVLKCLGCGIFDMPLKDIEVLREESGRPYVVLYGKALEKAQEIGAVRVHVSISHAGGFAAAEAVADRGPQKA